MQTLFAILQKAAKSFKTTATQKQIDSKTSTNVSKGTLDRFQRAISVTTAVATRTIITNQMLNLTNLQRRKTLPLIKKTAVFLSKITACLIFFALWIFFTADTAYAAASIDTTAVIVDAATTTDTTATIVNTAASTDTTAATGTRSKVLRVTDAFMNQYVRAPEEFSNNHKEWTPYLTQWSKNAGGLAAYSAYIYCYGGLIGSWIEFIKNPDPIFSNIHAVALALQYGEMDKLDSPFNREEYVGLYLFNEITTANDTLSSSYYFNSWKRVLIPFADMYDWLTDFANRQKIRAEAALQQAIEAAEKGRAAAGKAAKDAVDAYNKTLEASQVLSVVLGLLVAGVFKTICYYFPLLSKYARAFNILIASLVFTSLWVLLYCATLAGVPDLTSPAQILEVIKAATAALNVIGFEAKELHWNALCVYYYRILCAISAAAFIITGGLLIILKKVFVAVSCLRKRQTRTLKIYGTIASGLSCFLNWIRGGFAAISICYEKGWEGFTFIKAETKLHYRCHAEIFGFLLTLLTLVYLAPFIRRSLVPMLMLYIHVHMFFISPETEVFISQRYASLSAWLAEKKNSFEAIQTENPKTPSVGEGSTGKQLAGAHARKNRGSFKARQTESPKTPFVQRGTINRQVTKIRSKAKKKITLEARQTFSVNFGPQHPSAHGVLRLVLDLAGESIRKADPHIGLLHRSTEKLIESKTFSQALPYVDRLDYVSRRVQEQGYALTAEALLKLPVPDRAQYIRTIFAEITRLLNHIRALTTHARDVGALTPFLWAFEEREKRREFYERISGTRRHTAFIRPGGISNDIPLGTLESVYYFARQFNDRVNEREELLTDNRIWRQRLRGVAIVSVPEAFGWNLSGVRQRGSGLDQDLRRDYSYEAYEHVPFIPPVTKLGDCFDRYFIRIEERRQTLNLLQQLVNLVAGGPIKANALNLSSTSRLETKQSREGTIEHFHLQTGGFTISANDSYASVEAPKGEFGRAARTASSSRAYRNKFKAPGYSHLQGLNFMTATHMIADVVAAIGSQDIVFGEVDR